MSEGIDISVICDKVMSTLKSFLVNVRTFLLVLLLPFCMKFMSKALLHTCTYQSWSINLKGTGKTSSRGSKNGLLNSYFFEGLLLMYYARWKVYFKWIMPPEIAGLAPRTNLIFSPATAGAVTDGCEGIIQPGWQKLAAFRRGQKCLKKIFARPVFAIFATTASFLRATAKQINFNILFKICHVIMQFLTMKHYCCPKKALFGS